MKQDIKNIKSVIYNQNGKQMNYIDIDNITPDEECKTFITSIEHLIKEYKELEEENKIIKGNYYTLSKDIQMVTTELGFPEDTIIADEMIPMIKENYIPVSLVKEKIEEYKKKIIEARKEDDDCKEIYYEQEIEIMKELLEKRK